MSTRTSNSSARLRWRCRSWSCSTLRRTRRSRRRRSDGRPGGGDEEPEKKLPPVLSQALQRKRPRSPPPGARRSGSSRPTCATAPTRRSRPRRSTSWPSSTGKNRRRSTSRRWARYQAAVTACHNDRAACPKVPRRPPTVDLAQAQAVYLRLINQYPKFRKIDTVIYLYAFSLRDQGKTGESIKYFQTILDKYPRSRYIADAWMAIAEYRFYEQQNYKSSLEAYEKVLQAPEVAALRPGAVQDRLVLLEAGRHHQVGDAVQGRARPGQEEGAAAPRPSRSAPPSCRARRSTTWSSCSPRTTPRAPTTPSSSWRRSAARHTRARC